jgi:UDP-glucose 4-epimerase
MRIAVTGGAGFIGSNICDALLAAGHDVLVIDNLNEYGGGRREHVPAGASFELVDVRDAHALTSALTAFKPEVISHQAAQTSVARSSREPVYDAEVNVLGMLNVLNAARTCGARKVVFASTAAAYGTVDRLPIDEQTPQLPISPYGLTKYAGERYLQIYAKLHGLEYTILRYGNIYGPRQNPQGEGGVVAIFTSRFIGKDGVQINGDGDQTRDFTFVGDVARANLMVLEAGTNEAYVIGRKVQTSVNQLYEALCSITGFRAPVTHAPPRPAEVRHSYFNPVKAWEELGWRAESDLEDGLRKTVTYYAERLGAPAAT